MHLVGNTDSTATDFIFSVKNRALDPYYGPIQTYMTVDTVRMGKWGKRHPRIFLLAVWRIFAYNPERKVFLVFDRYRFLFILLLNRSRC